MGGVAKQNDLEKVISLGDDLTGILEIERESEGLMQYLEEAETLQSSREAEFCKDIS